MVRGFLTACGLALAGCAGLDAAQCRGANWQQLGERDGLMGLQPQIEQYAAQCAAHGVTPQAASYAQGWRSGHADFSDRTAGSGVD